MTHKIGILFGDRDNPFWQEQILWYKRFLPEYSLKADFFLADNPADLDEQALLCKKALESDIEALIIHPLDSQAVARIISENNPSIPIFDVGELCDPQILAEVKNYYPLPIYDYAEQGRMCAEALFSASKKIRSVACIADSKLSKWSTERVHGVLSVIQGHKNVEFTVEYSDLTREAAHDVFMGLADKKPDAVFCVNDLAALGVSDAAHEKNISPLIGGADLIPSAVHAVKTGELVATVGVEGDQPVHATLKAVHDFLTRGEIRPEVVDNRIVTRKMFNGRKKKKSILQKLVLPEMPWLDQHVDEY